MQDETLYRYTSKGEGIFMIEDKETPPDLRPLIERAKRWLPSPHLDFECTFYMKQKGKEQYERTLLPLHRQYMREIQCEEKKRSELGEIVYEDAWQVAERR